jgi:hypothetical protein
MRLSKQYQIKRGFVRYLAKKEREREEREKVRERGNKGITLSVLL